VLVAGFAPAVLHRFDLAGMDPRGMVGSTPITCARPVLTPELTLFPKTREQFQQLRQKQNRCTELPEGHGATDRTRGHGQRGARPRKR
jgi:hypothetical protein